MLAYCPTCRAIVEWVAVSRARAITGYSRRTIYHWIDRSWMHALKLPNGYWMLCVESLPGVSKRPAILSPGAHPPRAAGQSGCDGTRPKAWR